MQKRGSRVLALVVLLLAIVFVFLFFYNNIYLGPGTGAGNVLTTQCSDQIDNEGDGLVDYPNDTGCDSLIDKSEGPRPIGPTPSCLVDYWVTDQQAYFGESPTKPNYVWIIKNAQQSTSTQINSPTDLQGSLLGVASTFSAESLRENVLRPTTEEVRKGWSLPWEYKRLVMWARDSWRQPAKITEKVQTIDTTQAVGVPAELQQYLRTDASVVSIQTENDMEIPALLFSWQMDVAYRYYYGFGGGSLPDGWWYYYAEFDVLANGDLNATIWRQEYINNEYQPQIFVQQMIIQYRQEVVFQGESENYIFYNYISKYFAEPDQEGNWNEWAMIYRYHENDVRVPFSPTFKAYFQVVNTPVENKILSFVEDYETGELTYTYINLDSSPGYRYFTLDWYYKTYFQTYVQGWNWQDYPDLPGYFAISSNNWHWQWSGNSEWFYGYEHLLSRFKHSENGQIESLGATSQVAEADESIYYYADQHVQALPIGLKQGKHKTKWGIVVDDPQTHSREDAVIFFIPTWREEANGGLISPLEDYWYGGWWWAPLGENIFTDAWVYPSDPEIYPWGPGLPWNLDYRIYSSQLKNATVVYNGRTVDYHEAIVSGMNTPRTETSLTKPQDEYQDKVVVETRPARNLTNGAFANDGMKYLFAFDDEIRLSDVHRQDVDLAVDFLGRYLCIKDYRNNNGKDSLLIRRDECSNLPFQCGEPECQTNDDCLSNDVCWVGSCYNEQCIYAYNPQGPGCSPDQCYSDSDCTLPGPNPDMCASVECVGAVPPKTPGQCQTTYIVCNDGASCTADQCIQQGPGIPSQCANIDIPQCQCEEDSDCGFGQICCPGRNQCDDVCDI